MAMKTQPQDWAFIAACYQSLNKQGWRHERMLELVQHIISSGAASRLFAYTSLDTLNVSNYEPLEDSEILRIHFDRQKQLFCFEYFASATGSKLYDQVQPEFQRWYSSEIGIEKFDQFLRWIRW
ncbi:hypothetical protein GCM10028822_35350 [Hymenobacter terrigena]